MNQKWGGSPGGEGVGWCEETRAPPNPARVPSPAEIKRALVNGGLCRERAAGGGWLVTRIGSCGEMVIMVMRLGAEQHAALHASTRGRTETVPRKKNCDDRIRDSDRSDGARETRIASEAPDCGGVVSD